MTFSMPPSPGAIFHLTHDDQAKAIASVSRVLRMGAPFLFTAGDVDDADDGIEGTMNGVAFHYYSFGVEAYRRLLRKNGLHCSTCTKIAARMSTPPGPKRDDSEPFFRPNASRNGHRRACDYSWHPVG